MPCIRSAQMQDVTPFFLFDKAHLLQIRRMAGVMAAAGKCSVPLLRELFIQVAADRRITVDRGGVIQQDIRFATAFCFRQQDAVSKLVK